MLEQNSHNAFLNSNLAQLIIMLYSNMFTWTTWFRGIVIRRLISLLRDHISPKRPTLIENLTRYQPVTTVWRSTVTCLHKWETVSDAKIHKDVTSLKLLNLLLLITCINYILYWIKYLILERRLLFGFTHYKECLQSRL